MPCECGNCTLDCFSVPHTMSWEAIAFGFIGAALLGIGILYGYLLRKKDERKCEEGG